MNFWINSFQIQTLQMNTLHIIKFEFKFKLINFRLYKIFYVNCSCFSKNQSNRICLSIEYQNRICILNFKIFFAPDEYLDILVNFKSATFMSFFILSRIYSINSKWFFFHIYCLKMEHTHYTYLSQFNDKYRIIIKKQLTRFLHLYLLVFN